MIKNERRYRITRMQVERFARTLQGLSERSGGADEIHPIIAQGQVDAVSSQLADLEAELREYEAIREGESSQWRRCGRLSTSPNFSSRPTSPGD